MGAGLVGKRGAATALGSGPYRLPALATKSWGSGSNPFFAGQEAGHNGWAPCWYPVWPGEQESSSLACTGGGQPSGGPSTPQGIKATGHCLPICAEAASWRA